MNDWHMILLLEEDPEMDDSNGELEPAGNESFQGKTISESTAPCISN